MSSISTCQRLALLIVGLSMVSNCCLKCQAQSDGEGEVLAQGAEFQGDQGEVGLSQGAFSTGGQQAGLQQSIQAGGIQAEQGGFQQGVQQGTQQGVQQSVQPIENVDVTNKGSPVVANQEPESVFSHFTNGVSNFRSALKGWSPHLNLASLSGSQVGETVVGPSAAYKELKKDEKVEIVNKGPPKLFAEWPKHIGKPLELIKAIAAHYKLDWVKLREKLGAGLLFGVEGVLTPMATGVKVIERVFVPNACHLRVMCRMGSYFAVMKETFIKISPGIFETAKSTKAFSEGVLGKSCETIFPAQGCEFKLNGSFQDLLLGARERITSYGGVSESKAVVSAARGLRSLDGQAGATGEQVESAAKVSEPGASASAAPKTSAKK